jgi:adenine-specific DNA-methyltransferase
MMMPRLRLLRDLLRQDGVIFISIEENEIRHLKMLMDEIFGEQNSIGTFIWRKKEGGGQTDAYFVTEHEYIVVYARSEEFEWLDEVVPITEAEFNKTDQAGRFSAIKLAKWGVGAKREDRPKMYFSIEAPDGTSVYPKTPDGREGRWRVGKTRMAELVQNDLIYWEQRNGDWVAYEKVYFEEGKVKKIKERSILYELANTGDASIVLDSFAGSGTTAHAVLDLNKEDGGNRKFILVECEDYANKITAERVRRVIKGVPGAKDNTLRNGLGSSFSFFELGEPIEMESILEGSRLPSYLDLARYVFYTATGEEFLLEQVDEDKHFIGKSKDYEVYLFYKPDLDYLKSTALTLEVAKALGDYTGKKKLVFAPTKYLDLNDSELLTKHGLKDIEYCQLPFEIYRLKE